MHVGKRAIGFNVPVTPGREIGSKHVRRAYTKQVRTKIRRQGKKECEDY